MEAMKQTSQPTRKRVDELLAQIRRLEAKRTALIEQRTRAETEELKVLADAYARKLQAAGLSIRAGIAALRPYEKSMNPCTGAAASRSGANAQGDLTKEIDQLYEQARQVFGDDVGEWMDRRHVLLGGQSPRAVATQPEGLKKVRALLSA